MYKNLLPIGSVVLLNGAKTKLMITGRIISDEKMETIYDYVGCPYPFGMMGDENQFFFNRDAIERVYFIGFQNEEELQFQSEVLAEIGELEIRDGQIVPKE
ncbi:MAG: DUF4176 domain-containing protein [Lachnospiraceae bacterium]|nr:DUF4176 domain-containing protein [Lachnospiraceae bacterium]